MGLFRLLLPQLPEYQAEIQARLSDAVGLHVEFESLDARWRFSGPELLARNVLVKTTDGTKDLAAADAVVVGVSLGSIFSERRVVPNRLLLTGVDAQVLRDGDAWLLNAVPVEDIVPAATNESARRDFRVDIENSVIAYQAAPEAPVVAFVINEAEWVRSPATDKLTVNFERDVEAAESATVEIERAADGADGLTIYARSRELAIADFNSLLPETVPSPTAGAVTLDLWLDIAGDGVRGANATFELQQVSWPAGAMQQSATVLDAAGKLEWSRTADIDVGGFDISRLELNGSPWSPSTGEIRLEYDAERELKQVEAQASYLNLSDLDALLGETLRSAGLIPDLQVAGEISGASLTLTDPTQVETRRYRIEGRVVDLGISGLPEGRAVRGLTAVITADTTAGSARLSSNQFVYRDPGIFGNELQLGAVSGGLTWRGGSRGVAILSDRLTIENPVFQMSHSFELLIPQGESGPQIDLNSAFSVTDVAAAVEYLPTGVMAERVTRWFKDALVEGSLTDGELKLVGPLRNFPFDDGDGEFTVKARYENGLLAFNGRWPSARIETGVVEMKGMRLFSHENKGSVLGNPARNAKVELADVREGVLSLTANGRSRIPDGLNLVRQSPIRNLFGDRIDEVSGNGEVDYKVQLVYPIRDKTNFKITANFDFDQAEIGFKPLRQTLTQISGGLDLTRATLEARGLTANLLGSPVDIELLRAAPDTGSSVIIVGSGAITAPGLAAEFSHPVMTRLSGATSYRATVRFPSRNTPPGVISQPLTVRVESDLAGLGIDAPTPLGKAPESDQQLQASVVFPEAGVIELDGSLTDRGSWTARLDKREDRWKFDRAGIRMGGPRPALPVGSGLFVSGQTATLRLNDWLDFARVLRTTDTQTSILRGLDLQVDTLFGYGQKVSGVSMQLDRNANDWLVQVSSAAIAGGLFVPLDLSGDRPVVLQMDRFRLLESDPEATSGSPENLPAINIRAADFQLGDHRFGELEAEIVPTESGIETRVLRTRHAAFSSEGYGSWTISEAGEQATALKVDLTSADTRAATQALGINSTIDANDALASLDLRWPGPPRRDFWQDLDGEFSITVNNGRLDEVDPGAGRVLGLMSIIELPRRLALDFRDVFAKGLSFDLITANYRIVNGEAFTCNLSLEGPAADIALIGRAGLARRNYNQTAVVRPKVGNTLPAVGAVMGGPQVAAALLLVSRIFKKPLQDIGQAYYQINGSWDEPTIERTTVERFYATGQLADCLQTTP